MLFKKKKPTAADSDFAQKEAEKLKEDISAILYNFGIDFHELFTQVDEHMAKAEKFAEEQGKEAEVPEDFLREKEQLELAMNALISMCSMTLGTSFFRAMVSTEANANDKDRSREQ